MGRVLILTGERGVGKTTVCSRVVHLAREHGYTCSGLLTLAQEGLRDVVDVAKRSQRRLTQGYKDVSPIIQGRFRFSARTLSWGNDVLSRATPCDLLVVDELGPLEVERQEGWVVAFDVLATGGFTVALVVVRPELVGQVRDRLPRCPAPDVITVTRENRDRLPLILLKVLTAEGSRPPADR